jgi:predicted house-cleaning noncanonical NTP pyrophosphatase (MazG superfamily)
MGSYSKLVRDNIPDIIENNGEKPITRTLGENEYKKELLKKLVEESNEALDAISDRSELIKELGDVQEVISAVINAFDLLSDDVNKLQIKRKEKRGGFEKRTFLDSVE